MPEAGSQPSQSANITIRTMPSQNDGMLAPKSEATALSRSSSERGHAAEATPSARCRRRWRAASAVPVRSSVAPSRPSTSGSTGRFIQIERPRSPRTTWAIQCAYCTGSGSFSPSESAAGRDLPWWPASRA